ncbi:MAG: RNA polymerase sigma-70 factor, partial [Alistipes sp.]|nr:RNA polymerase sigma-70 factor [Alistipes sp.]
MDRQSDELILQSLRQGSYDAFDALYMRYAPHVEAFAFCMLKNRSEAEDLAHDIFL